MTGEPLLRAGIFLGVFLVLALAELASPFRTSPDGKARRWPGNLGLFVAGILLGRVALPAGAVGFAAYIEMQGFGLLNLGLLPFWLAVPVAVVLLDLAIYAQHVVFHHVPVLWRLHRVHHADTELDVTTGIRFHPLEIGLSILIKLAVIALLGAPAIAVLIFEVLLNAGAMFSHANLKLPESVERQLSWLIVTPGMHRVHHSAVRIDTDSNYGFNLAIWDRIFRTFRPEPVPGAENVVLGLAEWREPGEQRLDRLITQPFRNPKG